MGGKPHHCFLAGSLALLNHAAHLELPWKRLNTDNPLPWNLPKTIADNYARFGYTGFVQSKKCIGTCRFLFEINRSDR
jgi:hypothetical protein